MKISTRIAFYMALACLGISLNSIAGDGKKYGGTWLDIRATAQPHWSKTTDYVWSLEKYVKPTTIQIQRKQTAHINYKLVANRKLAKDAEVREVSGEICVANKGLQDTRELEVRYNFQERNGTEWIDTEDGVKEIITARVIRAGQEHCYRYTAHPNLVAGREYRLQALISIDNHQDSWGQRHTSYAYAPFAWKLTAESAISNKTASLSDVFKCPEGFSCHVPELPTLLTDDTMIYYTVVVTNHGCKKGRIVMLENTAKLVEAGSKLERKSSASVTISTGLRRGD